MAENSKVFVSPGVYTAEKDLTFVAQSVGVTTLGVDGETKKGPAFEPIFIDSFDSFRTRFGDTDPEKFTDSQIPKYETSFIARSYLSQSNQLFVTRVLGLSGYDAGPSWQLLTVGELDETYVASGSTGQTVVSWTDNLYIPLTGGTLNTSNIYTTYTNGTAFADALSGLTTSPVGGASGPFRTANQITGETFYDGDGNAVGTLIGEISHFVNAALNNDSSSFDITGATEFYQYGFIASSTTSQQYAQITGATGLPVDPYNRLGIATNLTAGPTGVGASAPEAIQSADFSADTNDGWYNSLFDYKYDVDSCTNSCYSGGAFTMFASSASTASTYVEGAVSTGVSGSSDDIASTTVYAILPNLIKPGSSTHVVNLNGYTAATSASSWSEWSFYGAATNGGNNVPGQISSGNYFSYSSGTESWGNAEGAANGGPLALSAYQPTVYPFVGSNGTGSTLSAAVTTFTAAQYSGAVSDYKLQTCAGTSIGGSSPAYTAVQVTLSGFANTGILHDGDSTKFGNTLLYSPGIKCG